MISPRKAKHLDVTTMFTYSHANTPLGQSERVYYLSYFINTCIMSSNSGCRHFKVGPRVNALNLADIWPHLSHFCCLADGVIIFVITCPIDTHVVI